LNRSHKTTNREEYAMINRLLIAAVAATFVIVSGVASAQVGVGGNGVPNYPTTPASKNRKVTNHGVGGNAEPKYATLPASKNRKVSKTGVGGNIEPVYPKTGAH
jgi:hypothetical protein